VPRLFELPTALPSGLLHLYDCYYEIYNIAEQPWWTHSYCIEAIAPCAPPTYWKEDTSLPAMFNPLCSSTNQLLFKKSFYNQSNHYRQFNGSHHVPTTKSTLFVVNKDEWYTKEGHAKSMKDALHVQRYGKRHLSGWSDIKQWKNQAYSLSHCRVTWVWRHQAGRQAGKQLVS